MAESLNIDTYSERMIDIALGEAAPDPIADAENRDTRRTPLTVPVAIVQQSPEGSRTTPAVVNTKDISPSGMCVVSRHMLHVGHIGAVLMHRSNGEPVVIGVRVTHSRYVGDMKHQAGMEMLRSTKFTIDDFRNHDGELPDLAAA